MVDFANGVVGRRASPAKSGGRVLQSPAASRGVWLTDNGFLQRRCLQKCNLPFRVDLTVFFFVFFFSRWRGEFRTTPRTYHGSQDGYNMLATTFEGLRMCSSCHSNHRH
jgi:hypothetical protein